MSLKKSYFRFGDFRLCPEERVLLRGDHEAIALAPKIFDLLVFLAENSGHLVTRDELLKAIWPDSFVDENNLTVNISLLRRILGESPDGRPFIETVPKKGYRFLSGVTLEAPALSELEGPERGPGQFEQLEHSGDSDHSDHSDLSTLTPIADLTSHPAPDSSELPAAAEQAAKTPTPPTTDQRHTAVEPHLSTTRSRLPKTRFWLVAILLALTGAGALLAFRFSKSRNAVRPAAILARRSLAVMPFQNLKHDSDTDYLGFALADSIINKLGYISELSVRPSSSVAVYAGRSAEPRRVAGDLAVNTLLTGTYVKDGDNLRISTQLIEPATQRIIWQDTIDVKFNNLLSIQDTVTQEIVSGLSLRLSPQETEHLGSATASDPQAYQYYLRGVDLYASGNFRDSIKMLETAAHLDGRSAMTWAMLGRAYTTNASLEFGGSEGYRKAQRAYERALALEPDQIACRVYLANLFTDTGRPENAVPLLKQALALNPNFAEADWELSYAYRFGGMLNESVELAERARTLDSSVKLNSSAINAYLYLGEYDRFLASLPQGDNNPYILFYRGFAEYHLRQKKEAERDFDRAYQLDPAILQTQVGEALSLAESGQSTRGLDLLRSTESEISTSGVSDPEAMYKVAEAYSVLGDKHAALRMLQRSIDHGFFPYSYFIRDPLLEPIRAEAAFSQLLHNARHRSEEFQRAFSQPGG